MKKPTAIICSDIHLREDTPTCRTDDYFKALGKKIVFIRRLQEKYNCCVLDGGDLFTRWKSAPGLLTWAINNLPKRMITVAGNHDLPQHSMDMYHRSSLATLEAAGTISVNPDSLEIDKKMVIFSCPWKSKIPIPREHYDGRRKVLLLHAMTYHKEVPFPGAEKIVTNARGFLDKAKGFDLVIIGHNHKQFIVKDGDRTLISPGSLMRMSADQMDFQPQVYLWYAEDNSIEAIKVPIEAETVSRSHLNDESEEENRAEAFIERLREDVELGVSFEKNLERFFLSHKETKPAVENVVWEVVKGG